MAKELVQRVLVRAGGRRLGPVTTRVGWDVRSTSSMALLSAVVSGRGALAVPADDCATKERSSPRIRPTQSALSSSRASSAIASGGTVGSRLFEAGEGKTRRELRVKFVLVPAMMP